MDSKRAFALGRFAVLDERHNLAGVTVLGLCWAAATYLLAREAWQAVGLSPVFALVAFIGAGMLTIVAGWLGVGAVLWAMERLLGGAAAFPQVLKTFSRVCPPLWVGAPGAAYLAADGAAGGVGWLAALMAALGFTVFLVSLTLELSLLEGWSLMRAAGSVALTVAFTGSFVYLYG